MRRADPPHAAIAQARERYFALCDECDALEAGIAQRATASVSHGRHDGNADHGRPLAQLRARLELCRRARDDAFHAFGHALLEAFAFEVAAMTEGTREPGARAALTRPASRPSSRTRFGVAAWRRSRGGRTGGRSLAPSGAPA